MPIPPKAARPPKRSRKRLALLGVLALLLAGSLTLWGFYLTTRQPITKVLAPAQSAPGAAAMRLEPRYLFSIYGVTEPLGVAVTPNGDRIYATEGGGERLIRAFDADGKALGSFAPPDTEAPQRLPTYVSLDSAGQVYVVDRLRRTVDVYDAGGNVKSSLPAPFADGWVPLGVRVSGDSLLVTETTKGQHRVLKLDKSAKLQLQFGREGNSGEAGELSFPNAAVADARGRIYVSDSNNGRVQVFDSGGKPLYQIPGIGLPHGLEFDGYQRLHVVDTMQHEVKVFDVGGDTAKPLFSFGAEGMGDGQFNFPNDVAVDDNDRVYVADRANNRVQVWVY
jgi:DNA-binding beta-propeller fold protein YncE